MRITTNMMVNQAQLAMQRALARLAETQRQLADGRRIHGPEDDPAGYAAATRLKARLDATVQFGRQATQAHAVLTAGEAVLARVQPLLARMEELAVGGADGAKGPAERTNMASEVNELLEELVSLANSNDDGRYVLGGQETLSPPLRVTRDVAGNITAATWNPRGVDAPVSIDIAVGSSLQTSVSGTAAFGDDGDATFLPTLFIQLRDALNANDPDAVRTAMGGFAAVESRLGIAIADVGTRLRQADDALVNHEADELAARQALSAILDADLGTLSAELGQHQIAYQASLRAAALAIQPSLADFLL